MSTAQALEVTPELIAQYEPVIGLEVHCQLATRTKIFCGCPTGFGAPPNTNVCPVCLGLPGALPVLSRQAVEFAIQAGIALNCTVNPRSIFARKNYFYPDLPKGYQISQFDQPLAEHGYLDIEVEGVKKRIGITRIHMEDDAGKSVHDGFSDSATNTYVDLNRSGTPLIEIVSEPDMRSAEEAHAYFSQLKQVLQYVGVSTCDMEKGHLRCDANVSVRLKGAPKFGIRAEVKNLNSFRFLKMAIDYEISRQVGIVANGGSMFQETRLFDPDQGITIGMRSKEDAHDYRYFPEPDLLPLEISSEWMERVRASVPELPHVRRARFIADYGLREYDADVLTASRATGDYFEEVAKTSGDARTAANWVMGDLAALLNAQGKEIEASPISAPALGGLIKLIKDGKISGKIAKDIFPQMAETGASAEEIVAKQGLSQISDVSALAKIVDEIIAANPKQVEQYKAGKTSLAGFFVGQAMKASRGQADPAALNKLVAEKLA